MNYSVYDHDSLQPADKLRIEHSIYFKEDEADITTFKTLSIERLQSMREESAAEEQKIFANLCKSTAAWETQAGQTLLLDKAIEYVKTLPVKHTANQWEKSDYDHYIISNMVYKMSYYISEDTKYDKATQKSIPYAWHVSWDVFTNNPGNCRGVKIAGQVKKRYTDKDELDKYLKGRIKAYSHLFTEISPPIPREYVRCFCVNGLLLPGYTIQCDDIK